jgi:hypothetical protein
MSKEIRGLAAAGAFGVDPFGGEMGFIFSPNDCLVSSKQNVFAKYSIHLAESE